MKKILTLFVIILFCSVNSWSLQDERLDEYSFDTSELKSESTPYFAIAGGATFTFQFANFDEINKHLTANGFGVDEFSGQVNLWGGEGFTGVVYIPSMRVGFFSYGGSKVNSKDITLTSGNIVKREVEYAVGLTGLSIEYAYVPVKSFAVVGGLSLGKGDLSIQTYQTPQESDWNNYKPNVVSDNFSNIAQTSYWLVKPNLYFEYALTNFLMVRAGASYNMTFGNDWKQNYISTLKNVPDNLNANALQLQVGIFVGLFNY